MTEKQAKCRLCSSPAIWYLIGEHELIQLCQKHASMCYNANIQKIKLWDGE
jgi:hypothetical protein